MNPIVKSLGQREPLHDLDQPMLALFDNAGLDAATVSAARQAGISWVSILQMIVQHGPQALDVLRYLLAVMQSQGANPGSPPTPAFPRRRRSSAAEVPEPAPEPVMQPEVGRA